MTMEELLHVEEEDHLTKLALAYEEEEKKARETGKPSAFGEVARTIMLQNRPNRTVHMNRTVHRTMFKTQAVALESKD